MLNSCLSFSISLACLSLVLLSQISDAQLEEWCVADEQTPEDVLQETLDYACGRAGANCSMIQPNQACYLPNTVKDHASYAFNNYYQRFKHNGGSCFFNNVAMVTGLDPSYGDCKYEYIP